MENFELIDNLFQIAVLLCACVAAGILAIRHRNRSLLMLSLAYACFALGTIYYVLYLVIIGIWPKYFYVAEIWLAAWLFYLSVQILPREGMRRIDFPSLPEPLQRHCGNRVSRPRFRPILFCFRPCFPSRQARPCISRYLTCKTAV